MAHAYLDALDALACSRPQLEPGSYGPGPYYRADQRANMRDLADYRLLRLYVAPSDAELADAARGGRMEFEHRDEGVIAYYTAGQYYPREYRTACVRLLARCWWARQVDKRPDITADQLRKHAACLFGRGIASRWFA